MNVNFSEEMSAAMEEARKIAASYNYGQLSADHLFCAILKAPKPNSTTSVWERYGINTDVLLEKLEKIISQNENKVQVAPEEISLNEQTNNIIRLAYLISKNCRSKDLGMLHFIIAILKENNNSYNVSQTLLRQSGINYQALMNDTKSSDIAERSSPKAKTFDDDEVEDDDDFSRFSSQQPRGNTQNSATPMIDSFGKDLTRYALDGKLDPIVGRDKELERIAQILCRRKKNNPVLIGEPGVGKSAIAEGLALRITQGKVPRTLMSKRIISLDISSLVAGTKYRGQFEERVRTILEELEKNPQIILFIDELHTIVGAGSSPGSLDASNMFKPALARGEIQCIGATTLDEYRQYIEKDGSLERRFQKVLMDPTTPEETLEILQNIKDRYEEHHSVRYTDEALQACVTLSSRYISDRCLPDKAIDALDEAGSRIHIKNIKVPQEMLDAENQIELLEKLKKEAIANNEFNAAANYRDAIKTENERLAKIRKDWETEEQNRRTPVTEEDVAEVIAMMTGVPVKRIAKNEGEKLMQMATELEGKVIGQDEAIVKIAKAIRRNRAGLKDPNKPIGTFIFLGPTGVGKTYLAKVLAEYLFDSQDAMIRIDMSEYMEKHTISRLIGAPPGYVGYEEGGQLTEKVRRKPYSIVLLDEIEKAHQDVYNILLQVFDDGQLTDGIGRKVDFKNTIIIMTSNIGSRELKDFGTGVGFSTDATIANKRKLEHSVIDAALKKNFSPEFLNRIDDTIFFNSLTKEEIKKIIDIELVKLLKRVSALGLEVEITDKAKDFLVEKGWDSNYGARPLKRAIQKYVEDVLAEEILLQKLDNNNSVILDYNDIKEEMEVISKEKNSELTEGEKANALPEHSDNQNDD